MTAPDCAATNVWAYCSPAGEGPTLIVIDVAVADRMLSDVFQPGSAPSAVVLCIPLRLPTPASVPIAPIMMSINESTAATAEPHLGSSSSSSQSSTIVLSMT